MSVHPDASAERLFGIQEANNPQVATQNRMSTEAEFLDATESVIERVMRNLESGAKEYSKLSERGLSIYLADFLSVSGLNATAERYSNGHVDVTVECVTSQGHWKYLGECKIHRGYKNHVGGCEQLLGYCTGRELRAFCLDFVKTANAFGKMAAMRKRLDEERPLEQIEESLDHRIHGAFVTSHRHNTGSNVEILHLCCVLATSSD